MLLSGLWRDRRVVELNLGGMLDVFINCSALLQRASNLILQIGVINRSIFWPEHWQYLRETWSILSIIFYFIYYTLDILSLDSLKGSRFHGRNSACTPSKFTMFFSQEAHEKPPNGFFVNMASSSCPLPVPYSRINSNNYLSYSHDYNNPYLFLNCCNFLGYFSLVSKPINHVFYEFIQFLSHSPFETLYFCFISLLVYQFHQVIKLVIHYVS